MRQLRIAIIVATIAGGAIPAVGAGEVETPQGAASLALHDMEGVPRSLEDYRGRIVVLNFWATWCLPCREEMPIFLDIHDRYRDRGVDVIAASADEPGSGEAIAGFVREEGLTFPVWTGATVADMRRLGLGDALPATAILDREGAIAFRLLGTVTRERIEKRIGYLLGGEIGEAPARMIDAFEEADPHDHAEDHDEADHEAHAAGEADAHADHHDHGEEEEHGHGGVGMEGASLVPS